MYCKNIVKNKIVIWFPEINVFNNNSAKMNSGIYMQTFTYVGQLKKYIMRYYFFCIF